MFTTGIEPGKQEANNAESRTFLLDLTQAFYCKQSTIPTALKKSSF
jgi:hypothetical protein